MMLCIMAGMDQKDSLLAVACVRLVLLVFYTSRAMFLVAVRQAHDALHHGRFGPEAFLRFLAVACAMLVLLYFTPRAVFLGAVYRP